MKPIRLVMSGFGPFGDCQEIDFKKVSKNGLFLISGDTGAGKTTIFDAISFALFGEASTENRVSNSFCSGYRKKTTPVYVELEFWHRGKFYHIRRNPDYRRPAKRGERLVLEKKDAIFFLPDGNQITDFDRVTAAVEELLALDWRQFKQISMIAQGEFIRLLTADSLERGKIFRKAFGTQPLEEFQKRLAEQYYQLKRKCEEDDKSILQYLEGILADESWEFFEELLQEKKSQNVQNLEELLRRLLKSQKQRYQIYQKKSIEQEQELSLWTQKKTRAEIQKQQKQKLESYEERQRWLNGHQEVLMEKEQQLKWGEKARYQVYPAAAQKKALEEQWLKQKNSLETIEENLKESGIKYERCFQQYQRCRAKQPEIQNWKIRIAEAEKERQTLEKIEELQKKKMGIEYQLKDLSILIKKSLERQKELEEEESNRREENESLSGAQTEREKLLYELEKSQKLQEDYKKQQQQGDWIENKKQDYRSLQKEYQTAEEDWQEAEEQARMAGVRFRREIAGILAEDLEEGMPCPVCGSKSHPSPKKKSDAALKWETVEHLEELEKSCRKQRDLALQLCESAKAEIRAEEEHWKKEERAILEKRNEMSLKGQEEEREETEADWQNWLKRNMILLKKRLQDSEKKIEKKRKNQVRLLKIEKELSEILQQNSGWERERNNMQQKWAAGIAELEAWQKMAHFSDIEQAVSAIDEWKIQCQEAEENLKKAEESCQRKKDEISGLEGEKKRTVQILDIARKKAEDAAIIQDRTLKEQGFDSLEAYQSALLSETVLEQLRIEVEAGREERIQITGQILHLQTEIAGQEPENETEADEKIRWIQAEKAENDEKMQMLSHYLDSNRQIQRNVSEKEKKQKELRRQYLMMKNLSQTANGELGGKEKIKFEQYVQAFYFRQVIAEANKRFCVMSGGQFELCYREGAGDKRSKGGLELEVMDYYTGSIRDVTSLSGGESFQAALALALGLSDVIQNYAGGIQADAMFIDEGFGTLDENALEQAIQTLSGLAGAQCMIGIISHVRELKERIEQKILVEKTKKGSRIEIMT